MSLPNPSMTFTPFDPLPASDLNDLVENDQALAAGTGLDNLAVTTSKLALGAVIPEKLDLSTIGVLTGWSGSAFGSTETSLGSTNVVIPTGCTKVLIVGTARLQSADAGTRDITARVRYDGGTAYTALSYFTATSQFAGSSVAFTDILSVTAGTKAFALMARSSSGTSTSSVGKILIIPTSA